MRHQLAIFIGESLSVLANGVKQYALKYGNDSVVPYFHSMMWSIGNDGSISVKEYDKVSLSKSGFDSNLDSEYLTGVSEVKTLRYEDLYIQDFLNSFRNETITIECPGDSGKLLVSLYVPMYDNSCSKLAEQIVSAAHEVTGKFEIDVIALTPDVERKLRDNNNSSFVDNLSQYKKDFLSNLKVFSGYSHSAEDRKVNQLVVLDNKNRSGIALDFNKESLISTLGEYSLLTVENYGSVYNQNIVLNSHGDVEVATFGLSSLYFDKYYFINYVLRKAYINLIDKEKVNEDGGVGCSWDINWAADQAKNLIGKHVGMVGKFWNDKINPLIVKEVSQNQIASEIKPELNKVYDDLEKDLLRFLSEQSLSLPQKKALLAMLTANDDESLQGNLLMSDTMSIDDLDSEPTNFFINESHKLPEDSEYRLPDLPIKEIKKLRNGIRQSTAYLRKKTEELDKLGKQIDNVEQSKKVIVDGKITVGDFSYKLITDVASVQLLEENYEPHDVNVASVDLSSWFTSVKNQADLGACTVFSLVSIFEYIIKRKTGEDSDLSEMFVYYNARKKLGKQNEDCGTSLYHVVKAMSDEGVCLENNCNYNVNSYSEVPYDSAYEDGKSRLVEVAKNMPIQIDAIRSALSDGYPVAMSFKIFGSFDAPKGFAITPSTEELSTECGYHAMVVVGYNDEHKLLKVRNSWGTNWGDKGYCYIPYSWITTLGLAVDACVITKTNQSEDIKKLDFKSVDFDLTDASIKSYILKNLVLEETKKLESLKTSYAEKRKEYESIVQKLGNHGNRKTIVSESQKVLISELEDCKRYKLKKEDELQAEVLAYEKETNSVLLRTALFMVSTIALVCYLWYCYSDIQLAVFDTGNVMLKTTLVLAAVLTLIGVFVFYFFRNYRKIQLKGMQEEMKRILGDMAHEIQKKTRVINELDLKCNIYGTSLDRLISIQTKLVEKYRASVSFVGNLKSWRNDESEMQNNMRSEVNRSFVPVLENEKLDSFVDSNISEITKDLVLYKYLESDYKLSDAALLKFKNEVKGSVIEKVKSYCSDFSMVDYLLGNSSYDYLDKKELKKVLPVMQSCSEPFCETKDTMAYTQTKTIDVYANVGNNGTRWKSEFCSQFQEMPTTVNRLANHSIVLMQQRFVSIDDIIL